MATKTPTTSTRSAADLAETTEPMLPRTVTLWVKRALLLVLVGLIVLIVMQQMRASRAAKVAQGYAELDKAVTADDYDRVSANYAGTAIATQAQLSAAERLFEAGSYADAAERFAKAAAGKDAVLALRGMVGQGLALEAAATTAETMDTAKLTEAASAFGAAADKAATLGMKGDQFDAMAGQSRCQRLLGNIDQAREIAERAKPLIADDMSTIADQVMQRMGQPTTYQQYMFMIQAHTRLTSYPDQLGASIDTYQLAAVAPAKKAAEDKPEGTPAEEPKTEAAE